jgi:hypothetical protein
VCVCEYEGEGESVYGCVYGYVYVREKACVENARLHILMMASIKRNALHTTHTTYPDAVCECLVVVVHHEEVLAHCMQHVDDQRRPHKQSQEEHV